MRTVTTIATLSLLISLSGPASAQDRRLDIPLGVTDADRSRAANQSPHRLYQGKVNSSQSYNAGLFEVAKASELTLSRIPARTEQGREGFQVSSPGLSVLGQPARHFTLNEDGQLQIDFKAQDPLTLSDMTRSSTGALIFKTSDGRGLRITRSGLVFHGGRLRGRNPHLSKLKDWPPSLEQFLTAIFGEDFDLNQPGEVTDGRSGTLQWKGPSAAIAAAPVNPAATPPAATSQPSATEATASRGAVGALRGSEAPPTPPALTNRTSPSQTSSLRASVDAGQVLGQGHQGSAVSELQRRLNKLGFNAPQNGSFDAATETALKNFQRNNNVAQTGRLGPTTLQALERAEKVGQGSNIGRRLAQEAIRVATRRNTYGRCYSGVAESVDRVIGRFLYGMSAYMAANQLARHPKFQELPGITGQALRQLPAGAIVVWRKTGRSPHGHISVATGDGREASDHVDVQRLTLRGDSRPRVFMPLD